jgi:cytochrome c oxidase assembly protein subunit 15
MLHIYSLLVAGATLLLIMAGAMVTSTGSGLAVPDWPTSYGYNMFTFPPSSMVGGIFYEHGHRLIASAVGLLTILLAVWLWCREPRRWLRRLGVAALAVVILQGILGGVTVLWLLPAPISIGHAGLAQLFFCLTTSIALFTSRGWKEAYGAAGLSGRREPVDDRTLRRLTIASSAVVFVQILLGATMRHTGGGLAIPDFPLAFGGLLPPRWDAAIAVHFAHRLGALAAAIAILATAGHIWSGHRGRRELVRPALLLLLLVAVQIALGAYVVLTRKAVPINTAHVVTGALILAASVVLALRAHRIKFGTSLAETSLKARTTEIAETSLKARATEITETDSETSAA